jgi:hypothetical protein
VLEVQPMMTQQMMGRELQLRFYASTSWSDGSIVSFCRFLHLVTLEIGGIFLEVLDLSWSLDLG